MPAIRLREPRINAHTSDNRLLVGGHQYLRQSLAHRDHALELASEEHRHHTPNVALRLDRLRGYLSTRRHEERDRLLTRLNLHPRVRDQIQDYWDLMDTAHYLADQRHIFESLLRQNRDRQLLHNYQADQIAILLLNWGADDILHDLSPGMGTPTDPVDVDHYETASDGDSDHPSMPSLITIDDVAEVPLSPVLPRRPINSSGSEVDINGIHYHRDGRPCTSTFPHGPDYQTDTDLEREFNDAADILHQAEHILATEEVFRQLREGGDSDPEPRHE